MATEVNADIGSVLATRSYLDMKGSDISSCSTDPFQTLFGIVSHSNFYGLDDFDEAMFSQSTESAGFPCLERSGSTIKMDSILYSEDQWPLASHQSSSEPSCSCTSLPEGDLQHFCPTADHDTSSFFEKVENPSSICRDKKVANAECNITVRDIVSGSKRKCSYSCSEEGQVGPPEVSWRSKNLIAERNRRLKANKLLMSLRAVVPNISKMDKASIIADAIGYIQSLQKKIKETETHLSSYQSTRHQYIKNNTNQPICSRRIESEEVGDYEKSPTKSQVQRGFKLLEVDVTKVEGKISLIRMSCKKERGIIMQLTRALDSLQLDISDASHMTLNGYILSTFLTEVEESELMKENQLRKDIVEAVSNYGFHVA